MHKVISHQSPTYPTESFFKGWDSASYFQTTETGGVVRVSTGDGFNTDTFRNFNTGSREFDGDSTNSPSEVPWFMDAKNDTYHALSASSTLTGGPASVTKLALYNGDITASAVPIGPAFNLYSPPATITITPVFTPTNGTPGNLSTTCGGSFTVPGSSTSSDADRTRTMNVNVNGNPTTQWVMFIQYNIDGTWQTSNSTTGIDPNWLFFVGLTVEPNPDYNANGGIGTGNATITVRASAGANDPGDGTQESVRKFRIYIGNYTNLNELYYCEYQQTGFFDGATIPGGTGQQ